MAMIIPILFVWPTVSPKTIFRCRTEDKIVCFFCMNIGIPRFNWVLVAIFMDTLGVK